MTHFRLSTLIQVEKPLDAVGAAREIHVEQDDVEARAQQLGQLAGVGFGLYDREVALQEQAGGREHAGVVVDDEDSAGTWRHLGSG